MKIPLFRPSISEAAISAASEVLRSGWLGLGPRTREFETKFAEYVGAQHCVGLNSCTSAIHLALHVLDLPEGSEVITTPLTFVSTNHAILYERLTPVFADIDRTTGNLDPRSVAEKITDKTRAVIVVHYGGYPADLDELYALAREHNLTIIEDCAHACGAAYHGKKIGSHGDLHAFSFHAVKNLPTGDGGALTVRSTELDARLRRLRWLGIDRDTFRRTSSTAYDWDYEVSEVGFKYHMNDIEAAIGLAQLPLVDSENARRTEIAALYTSQLSDVDGVTLMSRSDDRTSSFHLFPILVEDRDAFLATMRDAEIGIGVHYRRNDTYSMYEKAELPGAEWFSGRVVSLPMHMCLTDENVEYVASVIRSGW
ncbi:MAG TPA: DegT/DnrJ/EryC1/StrS family aminotransferase [Gemmatimonadaceae bacterium]